MSRLDATEMRLVTELARRSERMYSEIERAVAIPTGGAFQPGLDELRGLLCARVEALGGRTTLIPGDPRPAWLTLPHERSGGSGGEPPATSAPSATSSPPTSPPASPPPTALISNDRGGSGTRVLIAGHIDTVHDPHGPFRTLTRESATIARGPGAVDMKGGIVLAMNALEALAEVGIALRYSVLLNSDEETGSFHSASAIEAAGRAHDVGIALEPASDNGGLVVERMGSGHFRIDCHGRTAHVGRDFEKGVSAVNALAKAILDVNAACDPRAGRIVNVGPLEGSLVSNAVPAMASAWGNVRFADATAMEELASRFDALNTGPDRLPAVQIHRAFARPAKPMTPAVEQFALAVRSVAEALGQSLPFTKTGGVCDGNILQSVGLPTLDTLGIRGGHLHRPDEFIEIPSIVERAQLLAIVLKRIASGAITLSAR